MAPRCFRGTQTATSRCSTASFLLPSLDSFGFSHSAGSVEPRLRCRFWVVLLARPRRGLGLLGVSISTLRKRHLFTQLGSFSGVLCGFIFFPCSAESPSVKINMDTEQTSLSPTPTLIMETTQSLCLFYVLVHVLNEFTTK